MSLGIYPAVDPLGFPTSTILTPEVVGELTLQCGSSGSRGTFQRYKELQDIIAILGLDELSEEDRVTAGSCSKS